MLITALDIFFPYIHHIDWRASPAVWVQEIGFFCATSVLWQLFQNGRRGGRRNQMKWIALSIMLTKGAETHPFLPLHISKSQRACIARVFIICNPWHLHISRSRSRHYGFCPIPPSMCQYLQMGTITPQVLHSEASNRIEYIYIEVRRHSSGSWVNDLVNLVWQCNSR